jgi:hypothetical protein
VLLVVLVNKKLDVITKFKVLGAPQQENGCRGFFLLIL